MAELYNTTVDELVGKEQKPEEEVEESFFDKVKDFVIKYKQKIIIIGASVLAAVAILITVIAVYNANEEKRMYRKYEKIELGMTMDEVEDILGKPEDVADTHVDDDDVSSAFDAAIYGFSDADFWYYRGKEYDKNMKASDNFDLSYDYQPYYQIRIAFDKSGKVVETYFNTNTDLFSILTDYGSSKDKKMTEIEFLDGEYDSKKTSYEAVKIDFDDGSSYVGTVHIYKGTNTFTHRWGDVKFE